MTKEELKEILDEIEKECKSQKYNAYRTFADSNNPYVKGDIVTDGTTTIKIEGIHLASRFSEEIPTCRYSGPKLKKDLTPFKSGEYESVFQPRVKK